MTLLRNNNLPGKSTKSYGNIGEDYAAKLLQSFGYTIIQRNFRSKFGEIDIVAKDADTLVFVEVKTRWSKKYGKPEEAVNARKLSHIKKATDYYLLTHPQSPTKMRIDVVAIEVDEGRVNSAKIIKVI